MCGVNRDCWFWTVRAGQLIDSRFNHLGDYLRPGDCLVLNDTQVLPARFFAHRRSGAVLEGCFWRKRPDEPNTWQIMLKGARKVRLGESFNLIDRENRDFCSAELLEKQAEGTCLIRVESAESPRPSCKPSVFRLLPPYIQTRATTLFRPRRTRTVTKRSTPDGRARWPLPPQVCISLRS